MHRQPLLQLLAEYKPTTPLEIAAKQRLIQFISDHDNCFERSLEKGHVTASAWLLNKDRSKALLMHHKKLNIWVQPGGHCDGTSDALEVAIKEAQEESGIQAIVPVHRNIFDIDIHKIPEYKGIPEHYHYDVRFLLQVTSDEELVQNEESNELRWVSKDRGEFPTDEKSVTRMFNKWLRMGSFHEYSSPEFDAE